MRRRERTEPVDADADQILDGIVRQRHRLDARRERAPRLSIEGRDQPFATSEQAVDRTRRRPRGLGHTSDRHGIEPTFDEAFLTLAEQVRAGFLVVRAGPPHGPLTYSATALRYNVT